ncbi:hypothetical protein Tco_0612884 [Tanacetum coccineum]
MECRVSWLRRNTFIAYAIIGSISINRGLIQAIPTSLPPQPIGKVDPHRFKGTYKDGCGGTWFQQSQRFIARRSVKVKELQDKRILKAFKLSYQEKYEHVGLKSQDHKMARLQDDVKRLYLVDDLKRASLSQLLMTPSPKSLMLSLEPSDAGTRNCDAVSTICMPS